MGGVKVHLEMVESRCGTLGFGPAGGGGGGEGVETAAGVVEGEQRGCFSHTKSECCEMVLVKARRWSTH